MNSIIKKTILFLSAIFFFVVVNLSIVPSSLASGNSSLSGLITLKTLAKEATPYPEAITNGQPTVIEFYADWCTTCQSMSETMRTLEKQYGDRINLVMLNIDDPQWDSLVREYKVTGIPQYNFLDRSQNNIDTVVGRVPKTIMGRMFDRLIS